MAIATRIKVVTDEDGDATVFTGPVHGRVHTIRYEKTDFADGVDFTITTEDTGQNVWVEEDVNSAKTVAPRQATHGTDGAAALYASGGTAVRDFVWAVRERIKIEIENGGDTKAGEFVIIVDE